MRPSARRATLLAGLGAGLVVTVFVATQWRVAVELWHVARLGSSDPETRGRALEALVVLRSERAVGRMVELLAGSGVRPAGLPTPVSLRTTWMPVYFSNTPGAEGDYILAVQTIGAAAVRPLRSKLRSSEPREREWAAYLVVHVAEHAAPALGDLFRLFAEPDGNVAAAAAAAAGAVGARDHSSLAELVRLARDEAAEATVRERALVALCAASELAALFATVRTPDGAGESGGTASAVRPVFLELSSSGAPSLRIAALRGLMEISGQLKESGIFVPDDVRAAVRARLVDPERDVRLAALEAAGAGLATWRDAPVLRQLCEDGDPKISMHAALLLIQLGELRQEEALLVLGSRPEASDPVGEARERADEAALAKALREAKVGPAALAPLLKSPDPLLRRGAAIALGHYGLDAAAFGPALLEAAGGKDEALQAEALVSLSGVGGVGEAALVEKAAALLGSSPHARVRAAAAQVLGEAGADARAAAPLLRKASEDEDARVRAAAARALQLTGEGR
ncbi:MAG: HEAT repeat domain-containing protein [Planctomycetes bacterium]|nr:HEAT repeat domain-containing protein [Planctomycetota bacterium]